MSKESKGCTNAQGLSQGRFYVGLLGHITVLNAPELEAYAEQYFKDAAKK